MGFEIATALRKLYPNEWQVDKYLRLLVNQEVLETLKRGETVVNIEKLVRPKLDQFANRRASYLLYK